MEALTLIVDGRAPVRTVREWARRCRRHGAAGIGSAADLRRLTRRVGAPAPKAILDRLRLAHLLAYAAAQQRLSRDRLARRFGYATGHFLGRTARRLAGVPFGTLRDMEVEAAVSRLTAEL